MTAHFLFCHLRLLSFIANINGWICTLYQNRAIFVTKYRQDKNFASSILFLYCLILSNHYFANALILSNDLHFEWHSNNGSTIIQKKHCVLNDFDHWEWEIAKMSEDRRKKKSKNRNEEQTLFKGCEKTKNARLIA